MRYFTNCKSIEDVKSEYRKLAKELHPDCGGNAEDFKTMMNDYKRAFERWKDIHATADGGTYGKAKTDSEAEKEETPEQFAELINQLIRMQGVNIDLVGSWIWLSGNTYEYKETIKELHFFYSRSKQSWYYNGETEYHKRRGHYSMNQIKAKYGCRRFAGKETPGLDG